MTLPVVAPFAKLRRSATMRLSPPLLALVILPFSCAKGIQEQARLRMGPIHLAVQRVLAESRPAFHAFPMHRLLQDEEPDMFNVCISDESPNFDDDYTLNVFATDYNSTCTCFETDESQISFLDNFEIGVTGSVEDFVALWNENLPGYKYRHDISCENTCEACFEDVCGIITTDQSLHLNYTETEMTAEDIMTERTGQQDFYELLVIEEGVWGGRDCMEYTSGVEGTICYGYLVQETSVPFYDFLYMGGNCTITYNGEACSSCEISMDASCVVADCNNLQDGANVDTCAGTGMDGYFRFLKPYFNYTENGGTGDVITQGECFSEPSPGSPSTEDTSEPPIVETSGVMEASVGYAVSALVAVVALIV